MGFATTLLAKRLVVNFCKVLFQSVGIVMYPYIWNTNVKRALPSRRKTWFPSLCIHLTEAVSHTSNCTGHKGNKEMLFCSLAGVGKGGVVGFLHHFGKKNTKIILIKCFLVALSSLVVQGDSFHMFSMPNYSRFSFQSTEIGTFRGQYILQYVHAH